MTQEDRLKALATLFRDRSQLMLDASDFLDDDARRAARSASLAFSSAAFATHDLLSDLIDERMAGKDLTKDPSNG